MRTYPQDNLVASATVAARALMVRDVRALAVATLRIVAVASLYMGAGLLGVLAGTVAGATINRRAVTAGLALATTVRFRGAVTASLTVTRTTLVPILATLAVVLAALTRTAAVTLAVAGAVATVAAILTRMATVAARAVVKTTGRTRSRTVTTTRRTGAVLATMMMLVATLLALLGVLAGDGAGNGRETRLGVEQFFNSLVNGTAERLVQRPPLTDLSLLELLLQFIILDIEGLVTSPEHLIAAAFRTADRSEDGVAQVVLSMVGAPNALDIDIVSDGLRASGAIFTDGLDQVHGRAAGNAL